MTAETTQAPPSERVIQFDQKVAPMLQSLCDLCGGLGMTLSAAVEVEPDKTSYVFTNDKEGVSLETAMIRCAIMGAPNLDRMVMNILKFCRDHKIDVSGSVVAVTLANLPRQ